MMVYVLVATVTDRVDVVVVVLLVVVVTVVKKYLE